MDNRNDPSWLFYPQTLLELSLPAKFSVDLRKQITSEEKNILTSAGLTRSFAVLTACDPKGYTVSEITNAKRTADLERELRTMQSVIVPANGISPDCRHTESGFAVDLALDQATEIARRYDQSAFFWFDGEQFWIMPALIVQQPIPLPFS